MARTGLDKADIKQARDSLRALNQYPSVDAVRIALGNTGSKSTIHKYLKELDAEEGGAAVAAVPPVSAALQDLVARLAVQLQAEADERVSQAAAEFAGREQALRAAEELARQKLADALRRSEQQGQQAQAEQRKLLQAAAARQEELNRQSKENAKLVADLAHARLAIYDAQRVSREQESRLELQSARVRELELELAGARAASMGQQGLADELRRILAQRA